MGVVVTKVRVHRVVDVRAIGADAEAFEGVANGHENVMAPLRITSTDAAITNRILHKV